jgi:hypothetical protein
VSSRSDILPGDVLSFWTFDPGGMIGWAWGAVRFSSLLEGDPSSLLRRKAGSEGLGLDSGRWNHAAGEVFGWDGHSVADGAVQCWGMVARSKRELVRRYGARSHVRTIVGVEGFTLMSGAKNRGVNLPLRLLGAFDVLRQVEPSVIDEYHEPQPSAKSVVTDERLRRWGLWNPGRKDANDAVRHLIVLMRDFTK